jgi:hypothetical protein
MRPVAAEPSLVDAADEEVGTALSAQFADLSRQLRGRGAEFPGAALAEVFAAGADESGPALRAAPRPPRPAGAFAVVQPQGAGDRVKDAFGHAADATLFQLRVLLRAHAGKDGDLLAPQPGDPATGAGRQSGLRRGDPGAAAGEEVPDFAAVSGLLVHVI